MNGSKLPASAGSHENGSTLTSPGVGATSTRASGSASGSESGSASGFEVLVTDRFDAAAFAHLARAVNASHSPSHDLTTTDLANVQGLIIRSRTRIDETFLKRAPKLRAVITATSGFDHIDLKACATHNVKAMFTPNANAPSAAELTFALVLAAARRLPQAHAFASEGNWTREMGVQLAGKIYGVIGFGRIGSRVARMAEAFGMSVIVCDPYKTSANLAAASTEAPRELVTLDQLLAKADVVSAHVPATLETLKMIKRFSRSGQIFVNTSRGQIVEEAVLTEALDNRTLAAVGLDVFEREPLPKSSALIGRANVVLTPHIGATTTEAFAQASMDAAEKMMAFAHHGTVTDEI